MSVGLDGRSEKKRLWEIRYVVAHICNPTSWVSEARRLLRIQDQHGLNREIQASTMAT